MVEEDEAPPKIRFQKGSVLLGSVTGGVGAAVVVTSAGEGLAVTGAAITSLAGSVLLTCSGLESGCEDEAPPKIRLQKGSVLLGSLTGGVGAAVVVTCAGGGLAGPALGTGALLWVAPS